MSTKNPSTLTFPCPVCREPVPLGAVQCPNSNCKEDLTALAMIDTLGGELYQIALERIRQGKRREAVQILTTASVYAPRNTDIRVVLGKLQAQAGRYEEAICCWEQALALEPDEPRSRAGIDQAKDILRRRRLARIAIWLVAAVLIFSGGLASGRFISSLSPSETAGTFTTTPTSSRTPTPSPSPSPTLTSSPSPSMTPTPSPSPSPTQTSSLSPTATLYTCRVSTGLWDGMLNVRSGPGMIYPVVGWLSEGEQVIVLVPPDTLGTGGWMKIALEPDLVGWVNSAYCR